MLAMIRARVSKKGPEAINDLGEQFFFGGLGLQKNMQKAFEMWTEAAELGSVDALYNLGVAYSRGVGVQKDKTKGAEFYTKAAMQGHVLSRHNLGNFEADKGNYDRAAETLLDLSENGIRGFT
ncbi:hypothetical protein THAOC_30853 [Thalassiosira oceanica]|uniref:Sel1 repeat family protein n=1 Tax=Thalassiosira oceanica TaxID=159749 RepID=K0R9H6_THAOC|nr:hypothetical protein THAOC_30853 [Thalassiosira oceanica]|eukprot:EJK50203.1 hypothetical protein THAOC_30853 [Thalassiosira oceanica]